ncbi:MAG: ABC transporter ATP-binding protein [Desulfurococcales archaeon]|nr:ABC transporter ATP-binding protein [Desulfurococcales archaeon]
MAGVRLEGIVKRFGRTTALKGINLEIRDGEIMVLLGPSGCGKTTTLRIIAGLEKPTEGRVFFDDREVTNLPPKDRNISMVFQSYAVWPHMKVYDNIAFPLKIKKVRDEEIRRRVKWAAELLQIEELLDRYPHQLSGGQRQRVAVARAIVVEPEVLLMDEPLSNLDALLRVKMRSEIKKLQRKVGVTMVYVTHDQTEAMVIADRIAVMSEGQIMQVGAPQEVYDDPANTFVAGFIGSPQMNLIKARVVDGVIEIPGYEIKLSNQPSTLTGGNIVIGVRPEKIQIGDKPPGPHVEMEGIIDFIENLGADYIVHVKVGDTILVAKTTSLPEHVNIGTRTKIYIEEKHIHFFDSKTGTKIKLNTTKK